MIALNHHSQCEHRYGVPYVSLSTPYLFVQSCLGVALPSVNKLVNGGGAGGGSYFYFVFC